MCDRFNELYPRYVSTSYTYGGMIRWFEKRRRPAAAIWESGLKCGYTSYCGMDCALLLWYASIRSPTLQVMQAAVDRMRQPYYARQRAGYLVDSLVRYLLDEIDEATLREAGVDPRWENQTLLNKACIEFYVAAKHFERGNRRGFARHVSRCAEAAGLYTISPELLLARHEVGMLPFQFPAGGYRHQLHPEVMGRLKRNRRKSDS